MPGQRWKSRDIWRLSHIWTPCLTAVGAKSKQDTSSAFFVCFFKCVSLFSHSAKMFCPKPPLHTRTRHARGASCRSSHSPSSSARGALPAPSKGYSVKNQMAHLANPPESVSPFAMFPFYLLKIFPCFPIWRRLIKTHEHGEQQYVWKKHCSPGKRVSYGIGRWRGGGRGGFRPQSRRCPAWPPSGAYRSTPWAFRL